MLCLNQYFDSKNEAGDIKMIKKKTYFNINILVKERLKNTFSGFKTSKKLAYTI